MLVGGALMVALLGAAWLGARGREPIEAPPSARASAAAAPLATTSTRAAASVRITTGLAHTSTTSAPAGARTPLRERLNGDVVDARELPVRGARVTVEHLWGTIVTTTTGPDGAFATAIERGSVTVVAQATGHALGIAHATSPGSVRIVLEPARTIAGRVVRDDDGTPVPGLRITSSRDEANLYDTSGSDGGFELRQLPRGKHALAVRGPGWAALDAHVVEIASLDVRGVELRVVPAASLIGRIVLGSSGEPCRRGRVVLNNSGMPVEIRQVISDSEGRAVFHGLTAGPWHGGAGCLVPRAPVVAIHAQLPAQGTVESEWVVDDGGSHISGRVLRAGGGPVPGAYVMLTDSDGRRAALASEVDGEGHYRLVGAPSGAHTLGVWVGDLGGPPAATTELVISDDSDTVVDLTLPATPTGAVRGTVHHADGRPTPHRNVDLYGPHAVNRSTDAAGRFSVADLPPGRYRVDVASARLVGATADFPRMIEVQAGATLDLALVLDEGQEHIRGRVVDSAGRPAAGVEVRADALDGSSGSEEPTHATTDGAGLFVVPRLRAGRYRLHATRSDGAEATAPDVSTGAAAVELVLRASGSIHGEVRGLEPDATASLRLEPLGPDQPWPVQDEVVTRGPFHLPRVGAGRYRLIAYAAEGVATAEVQVTAGQARRGVVLTLSGGATVRGRVRMLGGQALPDSTAVVWRGTMSHALVGADGVFELTRVPPGPGAIDVANWSGETCSASRVATAPREGVLELTPLLVRARRTSEAGSGRIGLALEEHGLNARVRAVLPGSSAARAGLRAGQEVVALDGAPLDGVHAQCVVDSVPVGEALVVTLAGGEVVRVVAE